VWPFNQFELEIITLDHYMILHLQFVKHALENKKGIYCNKTELVLKAVFLEDVLWQKVIINSKVCGFESRLTTVYTELSGQ